MNGELRNLNQVGKRMKFYNKALIFVLVLFLVVGQVWSIITITKLSKDNTEIMGDLTGLAVADEGIKKDINRLNTLSGVGEFENYYPEDEVWWYKLQCALTDPALVRVSLAEERVVTPFTVDETIYLKDYDDLVLDERDASRSFYWVAGGLLPGGVLSLPAGTYYHYGNSGVMYVTASDVESIDYDPVERYYRRVRYVLENEPDIEVAFDGLTSIYQEIKALDIPDEGAVISFGTGGAGFVSANLYLRGEDVWRSMNGMGPGVYLPESQAFAYTGNIYNTPLNMVPVPGEPYDAGMHVVMNDRGRVYFKVHFVPDWW